MNGTRYSYESLNARDEKEFNERFEKRRGFVPAPSMEKK
jgi:hypothetical protein